MDKNFDLDFEQEHADREREIQFRGQTFSGQLGIEDRVITRYLGSTSRIDQTYQQALEALLDAFFYTESRERFHALRNEGDPPPTIREVSAIAAWIVEQETNRPTRASSGSTAGRETNTATSTAGSSSQDSTTDPPASLSAVS